MTCVPTKCWSLQPGGSNLAGATLRQQPGGSNLAAATWQQQPGGNNLATAAWHRQQQPGGSNLAAAPWRSSFAHEAGSPAPALCAATCMTWPRSEARAACDERLGLVIFGFLSGCLGSGTCKIKSGAKNCANSTTLRRNPSPENKFHCRFLFFVSCCFSLSTDRFAVTPVTPLRVVLGRKHLNSKNPKPPLVPLPPPSGGWF